MPLDDFLDIPSDNSKYIDTGINQFLDIPESISPVDPVKPMGSVDPMKTIDPRTEGIYRGVFGTDDKSTPISKPSQELKLAGNIAKDIGKELVATSELAMSLASGMLLYLPAKAYGLMALPFGRDVADIAEQEISKLGYQPMTEKGKKAAELVGKGFELFLKPASDIGKFVSQYSPEAGYLIEFGAELAEFAMTGGIAKGVKSKFKPDVRQSRKLANAKKKLDLVEEDSKIKSKQDIVDQIPNEVIKQAQQKILDAEKVQLDLKIKELNDSISLDIDVREDLIRKAEEVARAKQVPESTSQPWLTNALEETSDYTYTSKRGNVYIKRGEQWFDKNGKEVNNEYRVNKLEEGKVKVGEVSDGESVIKVDEEPIVKEVITDLDFQTGTRKPEVLSTEKSPFRELDKEHTASMRKVYQEAKHIGADPELTVGKLVNDVNSHLDGVSGIDVIKSKNDLSNFAIQARDPANRLALIDYFDGDLGKVNNFIEMTGDAAEWARNAEVKIVEPTVKETPNIKSRIDENKLRIDKLTKEQLDIKKDMNSKGVSEDRYDELDEMYSVNEDVLDGLKMERESLNNKTGTKLYSIGGASVEGAKQLISLFKKADKKGNKARGLKKLDPKYAAKTIRKTFNRKVIDKHGNIRINFLDKLGDEGYKVIQDLYLSKGASTIAANKLYQMRKEVYNGLSRKEKVILDDLIFHSRILDIAKYKTPKQFKELATYPPEESIAYLNAFEYMKKLTPEKARELYHVREDGTIGGKTGAYFEWMKNVLDDMLEAELINKESYDNLKSHNYRQLKIVDIFDKKKPAIGKRGKTVNDSGIDSLARGRESTIFERDSEVMALEVFNRSYGRIMNNAANKNLLELAKSQPDNPFVRVKGDEKIPSGWSRFHVYEKGEKKSIWLSPEMSKEWINASPELSYEMSQFLRYASGSPVVRTFATGINWGFALANLPRDVMHVWFAARTFENGKWSSVYSPHMPVYAVQIGRDAVNVFKDAALRKGKYEDYINEGGGMEFLVHQGRIIRRGRHIEGSLDKLTNFFGYFGETSEIMTRLMVRDRVIRKRANEKGITYEDAYKNKDITKEATFAARDYMDFSQGGSFSKAIDNGVAYLNASIQGSRGLFRSFKPGSGTALTSTYKLTQFAAAVTGLYIAMNKLAPNTTKDLKDSYDMENNICIPLGDQFSFEDEEGQLRNIYFKIPLDIGQKFFKTFFEASTDKWLGNEVNVDRVTSTLKHLSPVGLSPTGALFPSVSGTLGYVTNKNFWRNEDIVKGNGPFNYPMSREEWDKNTPQVYKDIGETTGLSPQRFQYLVEELTTNGTIWSYLLGKGYDTVFSDLPKENKEQHLAMILSKIPISKRFIGVTNPYTKFAGGIDKIQEEAVLKTFVENRNFDIKVDNFFYGKGTSRKDILDEAHKYKDKDTYDRLMDRFKFEEAIKTIPNKVFWRRMKGLKAEAKVKVFANRLDNATGEEERELWKEYSQVIRAKGILPKNFISEVNRYRGENR